MNYLLTILVIVGNVLGAGMIVPQVHRLRQGRTAEGVSVVGVGVGVVQNLWWIIYGLQAEGAFGIVPVSLVSIALYATIGKQIVRLKGRDFLKPIGAGFVGVGLLPLGPYLLIDLRAAGLVIGLLYAVQFAPAAVAAVRVTNPVGVSASTWWMALVEAVIWFAYGMMIGDIALTVGGAGGSVMAGIILMRVAVTRQPRRTVPIPL